MISRCDPARCPSHGVTVAHSLQWQVGADWWGVLIPAPTCQQLGVASCLGVSQVLIHPLWVSSDS